MNTAVMFSSETDQWDTPQELSDDLATVFDWDLDVCASRPNVCPNYLTEADNGLNKPWWGLCWMNPPYGREIGQWVKTARLQGYGMEVNGELYQATKTATAVVCLVPARTDTKWWQENARYASLIVLLKGRLKFGGAKNSAPFPSAFMVFGEITAVQKEKLASYSSWGNYWEPIKEGK